MRAVAAENRSAFKQLCMRAGAKLHATVRRILPSDAMAEDAVQEAFVRIRRRAGDGRIDAADADGSRNRRRRSKT